jgi:hypothetical protein
MDFLTVGSSLGILSTVIHTAQASFHIAKHFRLTSTCCNLKSSLEFDINDSPGTNPAIKKQLSIKVPDKTGSPK